MADRRRAALEARLEGRQIEAARLCVEREFAAEDERRSYEEIAEEAGVSSRSLRKWRTSNRAFIDYMNYLADERLESERAFVYRQLMKTISGSQPSIKAIDLFFRRFGLITQNIAVETKDAGAAKSNEELAAELEELDELLADADEE